MIALSTALNFKIWLQDVTKAYIRGHDLTRAVYVKATKDFELPEDQLLNLLKPLYRLKESVEAWFQKYRTHISLKL